MNIIISLKGYRINCIADGYSPLTIRVHQSALETMAKHLGNPEVEDITSQDLQDFMYYLRTVYEPKRNGVQQLSSASLHRYWKAIRSYFKWAAIEFEIPRPDTKLPMPAYTNKEVKLFTKEEIVRLLKACEEVEVNPKDGDPYTYRRPTRLRDKALILVLLDTGVRVGEFTRLNVGDLRLEAAQLEVRPHHIRKTTPRTTFLGKSAQRALWSYISKRERREPDDPLFLTYDDKRMNIAAVYSLLLRLGEKAGVANVHAHRFRHTCAIEYLRNGGDIFTLQSILGHKSLKMVRHYLSIATNDVAAAHRRASPADGWRL
jgi:integrase/recombinase XerD